MKMVTTLPAHHLVQKRKILNLYFYAVTKAQVIRQKKSGQAITRNIIYQINHSIISRYVKLL
jgi:hypothetical protein